MSLAQDFRAWYACDDDDGIKTNVAEGAFRSALKRLTEKSDNDGEKWSILHDAASLDDVTKIISESMTKYSAGGKYPKVMKWLQKASESMMHYSGIFDMFARHHPEYTSIVWGVIKLLFMGVIQHEKTVKLLAKSLAEIAERLPRLHLTSGLYPTPQMRRAAEELYSSILKFLMRAYDWYNEGKLYHIIHSFTKPPELYYSDLLEEITANSRNIDQLAIAASQAEMRDMHKKVSILVSMLSSSDERMKDMAEKMFSYHSIQMASLVDTNQRVSDVQLSQILSHLANVPLDDPDKSFQHHLFFRRRRATGAADAVATNRFWLSPKLQSLFSAESSALAVLKGGYSSRQALQDFCIDVVQQLHSSGAPILWALKNARSSKHEGGPMNIVDLLKYLTLQAMKLDESLKTEKTMSLRSAQFHATTTAVEWFELFLKAVNGVGRQVHLVIDLETVDQSLRSPDGFNIISALLRSFQARSTDNTASRLKVLIIVYGPTSNNMQTGEFAPLVVPVRATGETDRK
ncbi:hypothetical protein PT974_05326 [Cladobotryum mycophilum]|uniref:DUF7708 domain-containing protein n=1 Tax=Cladobotryum mycophilum TaxID=491253 RepID=A0ABR0SJB1_9HYPO